MFKEKNSTGVTLIECIVSIALGMIILSGIFAMYVTAEQSRSVQSALIAIQENAQMIEKIITREIHAAGYIGCAKLTESFPFKNHLNFPLNVKNKITTQGGNSFITWHANSRNDLLIKDMRYLSVLYTTSSMPFSVNDALIISDCKTSEAFQIKEVSILSGGIQRIVSFVPLDKLYEKNSSLHKLEITSYFVADTGRIDDQKHIVYALYAKSYNGAKTELIEGVDKMKIFYDVMGISFVFDLTAVNYFNLPKKWYFYAAL